MAHDGTTDDALVSDEVIVHIDGVDVTAGRRIPPRPDPEAGVGPWREYAVALGLDAELAASWDAGHLASWCG